MFQKGCLTPGKKKIVKKISTTVKKHKMEIKITYMIFKC